MYLKERPPIYAFKKAFLLFKKKEFPHVLSCFVKCNKNLNRSIKILYFVLNINYNKYFKNYICKMFKNKLFFIIFTSYRWLHCSLCLLKVTRESPWLLSRSERHRKLQVQCTFDLSKNNKFFNCRCAFMCLGIVLKDITFVEMIA